MKRTTLISASLLLAFAGCSMGQSERPSFFTRLHNRIHGVSNMGEPCDVGCQGAPVPMATGGCESCGNGVSMNYGGYSDGQIMNSYESTPMSIGTPTTSSIPYTSPTYQPGPTRANREIVNPRPAS